MGLETQCVARKKKKKEKCYASWDGMRGPVMDFRLVTMKKSCGPTNRARCSSSFSNTA